MSSHIFQTILNRKIENFVQSFVVDSKSIFYKDSVLIHPGEYGKYREDTLIELLRILLPTKFYINGGFIITSNDKVSTQCDIVIYDKEDMPFLVDGISQFYSIESVLALGEVKSDLSLSDFKNALVKLALNKKLQDDRKGTEKSRLYSFKEHDDLISFLVCRKLKFDITKIYFSEVYGNIDRKYWHNCILSIEDGLLGYNLIFKNFPEPMLSNFKKAGGNINETVVWEYPIHQENDIIYHTLTSFFPTDKENKFNHISMFINQTVSSIKSRTLFNSEFLLYSNLQQANIMNE